MPSKRDKRNDTISSFESNTVLVAKLVQYRKTLGLCTGEGRDEGGGNEERLIPKINMTMQSVIQIALSGRVIRVNGNRRGEWIMRRREG